MWLYEKLTCFAMRALPIVSTTFAIFAVVNSIPIKYSLRQRCSGTSSDMLPEKSTPWARRLDLAKISRLFLLFDKTIAREEDDEFPWVTTIPPLDKSWEQEISGGGINWGNYPLEEDVDWEEDEEAPVPLSTLIPIPGSDETKKQEDLYDVFTPIDTPQPVPSFQMPIPSSTPSVPPRPSPTSMTFPSPAPSPTPSISSSPQPSSSPTPSKTKVPSPSTLIAPSQSLIPNVTQKPSDRNYVVISGVKVDRESVTIVKAI